MANLPIQKKSRISQSGGARRVFYRQVPSCWQVDRSRRIDQMICEAPLDLSPLAPLPLGTMDVPEMLELTAATEPGPFSPQTIQMGRYFGIRASDGRRLVAMAGERLQSTAFAEISAVCTVPEFRGRGYARALVTFLAVQVLSAGKTPFLHVKSENGAKMVYQKIGFRLRAAICLTVISSVEGVVSCETYPRVDLEGVEQQNRNSYQMRTTATLGRRDESST